MKRYLTRFAQLFSRSMVWLLPLLAVAILTASAGALMVSANFTVSDQLPYRPKGLPDYVVLLLWVMALVVPVVYLVKAKRRQLVYDTSAILTLAIMVPTTLYFLLMPLKVTLANTALAVHVSTGFFYVMFASLLVALIYNFYRNRDSLDVNPWWQFVIAVPYMFVLFQTLRGFMTYHTFVTETYFNTKTFYHMLKLIDGNLNLLTHTPFTMLGLGFIVLFIWLMAVVHQFISRQLRHKAQLNTKEVRHV